jgi:hypothetical protein
MTKYYLHTGLHKTGTKFFQHKVFPNIPKSEVEYNPPKLCQLICDLMKADTDDVSLVLCAIENEKDVLEKAGAEKVLISREIMSGDLFSFYRGYKDSYSRLHRAFPEADIIMALRYQVDWIVSCYRETLHEHHYQSLGQFLGLESGEDNFVKSNYKDLDYNAILSLLSVLYSPDKLHIFFYEEFRKDKKTMVKNISTLLGVGKMEITDDGDTIPNRGYSALAIKISIIRYSFLSLIGLDEYFVHRPIRFFGKGSIPAGFQELSVLPEATYWHDGFLRDNEEVRSKNYPDNLSPIAKLKLKASWRNLIKQYLDKLIYKDWDLAKHHRVFLDAYFREKNRELVKNQKKILGSLPVNYL